MSSIWSPTRLERAREILSKHTNVNSACEEMSAEFGARITRDGVDGALRRNGFAGYGDFLAKPAIAPPAWPSLPPRPSIHPIGAPPPSGVRVNDAAASMLEKLIAATRKKHITRDEACDLLDVPPSKLAALVAEAHAQGFSIELDSGIVGSRPSAPSRDEHTISVPANHGESIFAVVSDVHVGSKQWLRPQFDEFIRRAYDLGVRKILCPGDMLDGVYRFSVWEQSHRGFAEQAELAAEAWPQLDGLEYHAILGNHDETFADSSGMNVGSAIEQTFRSAGRDDLTIHGVRGAYLRLKGPSDRRGLLVEMWHPRGSGAYAMSYKLQKKIEGHSVGMKPDVLLTGHWHQQVYFTQRGVHAFSCGTWQGGGSNFGKSLGTAPAIGGWVIRYAQDDSGTVRELSPTWRAYYEKESFRDVEFD